MNVQLLLLCTGVAHRHTPLFLARLARSSAFLSGVSNRLAAPSHRARFLGMVVGESLSTLVEADPKMRLSFGSEETQTAEARRWKSLPSVDDRVGSLQDLSATTAAAVVAKKRSAAAAAAAPGPAATSSGSAVRQTRPDSDAGSDAGSDAVSDAAFPPYALPDSDPEDAPDDDATTVDRNKPAPPVYVARPLIASDRSHKSDRLQVHPHAAGVFPRDRQLRPAAAGATARGTADPAQGCAGRASRRRNRGGQPPGRAGGRPGRHRRPL